MDKRLAKRHKRAVSRAKDRVKTTEPDLRTPEQIQADRQAGRAAVTRSGATAATGSVNTMRGGANTSKGSAAKTDA